MIHIQFGFRSWKV